MSPSMKAVVIGISGRAGSGKDTLADALVRFSGFQRVAFADALKTAAKAVFSLDYEQCYGKTKEIVDLRWGLSPRQIFQRFGTDAMRREFGADIWVKAATAKIMELLDAGTSVVVPDVRFLNEALAIKAFASAGRAYRGFMWRVERNGIADVSAHVSEIALDDFVFDRTFNNDGTIAELHVAAHKRRFFCAVRHPPPREGTQ